LKNSALWKTVQLHFQGSVSVFLKNVFES
jgi:hypothetical protein